MCGICGIVSFEGAADPAVVDRMTEQLVHRGPDHGAVEQHGRCALGYRRLKVIDLRETGDQPVTSEDGRVLAVMNGELYNFRELRDELERRGHRVPGTGDTQVIPHLYEDHGPAFVQRLDGMFAIALWDERRERLVLARDRLGKKPLVTATLPDGTFAFASEAKALVATGMVREPSLEMLDHYLALGYVPADASAFAAARKVPPAHVLTVEDGRKSLERYWEPRRAPIDHSEGEWLELVRAEVTAAVRRRLVADVPLGALLSGGVDSSVVVAAMAESATGPVRTFSIGFPESRYDERAYAREVAERYGTEHEELVVDADAAALVPRLAEAWDEPFADSSALPTFLVCELARRRITVALTGDGGDEAFGGYERYAATAIAARVPSSVARRGARFLRALPQARREPRSPLFRGARFLELAARPRAQRYGSAMELFPPELRASLWSDDALEAIEPRPAHALLAAPAGARVSDLQLLDLRTYLPGDLLVKADIASMAHGLELRSPLLDHRVIELGLALPDSLKVRGLSGKVALRRAFADGLPPTVRRRKKRGFGVPVSRWFRHELRELAEDTLLGPTASNRGLFRRATVERLLREHVASDADHGARLWALVMLELWQRTYVDAPAPAPVAAPA